MNTPKHKSSKRPDTFLPQGGAANQREKRNPVVKMKQFAALLTAAAMTLCLAACGGNTAPSSAAPSSAAPSGTAPAPESAAPSSTAPSSAAAPVRIGVIQLMEHEALDAAYQGFVDGLAEAGYKDGEQIKIDFQNAQGEQANCQTIADKFVSDKVDLVLAIATPAAQAMANATKDIPILVTAVTDPADAKLVASNEAPGGNVTGTSDMNPVEEQMKLLKQMVPEAKTVGMLYNSGEANSKLQVDMAKKVADTMGLTCVDYTVSNANEIQQVVESAIGKVDAFYAPTDNVIANGMATVSMVTIPAKIPVICGEEGMVNNGGTATYGLSYYNLGKLTATQAVDIITGKSKPADMPILYLTDCLLAINEDSCQQMGLAIPQELKDALANK